MLVSIKNHITHGKNLTCFVPFWVEELESYEVCASRKVLFFICHICKEVLGRIAEYENGLRYLKLLLYVILDLSQY